MSPTIARTIKLRIHPPSPLCPLIASTKRKNRPPEKRCQHLRLNKTGGVALFRVFALGARSTRGAYTPPAEREMENQRQEGYYRYRFVAARPRPGSGHDGRRSRPRPP